MRRRTFLSVLTTSALLLGGVTAQASTATPDLQPLLNQLTASNAATAVLAEFREDRTVWRGSSGVARLGGQRPAPVDGRFRIASVTKTFVATVILQLVAERRISLDDTIDRWLPGLVPRGDRITVRHLLQHTTGIADYTQFLYPDVQTFLRDRFRVWKPKELIGLATSVPPLFEPGTSFSYSNTNYIPLGLVIERLTGKSFESAVAQRILRPLGMRDTKAPGTDPFLPKPYAHGYIGIVRNGEVEPLDISIMSPTGPWTAGGMISTTADLNRFFGALLGGKLLPKAQLTDMIGSPVGTSGYGLGIFQVVLPCGTTLWGHSGGIAGYQTVALSTEDGRRQLAVSFNPWIGDGGDSLLRLIVTAFCGQPASIEGMDASQFSVLS